MTITSVAAAVLPLPGSPSGGDPSAGSEGALFAGLLGGGSSSGTASSGPSVDASADLAEPAAEPAPSDAVQLLGAAQIMAAAQVVPVTPVLAAALALQASSPVAVVTGPESAAGSAAGSAATTTEEVPAVAAGVVQPCGTESEQGAGDRHGDGSAATEPASAAAPTQSSSTATTAATSVVPVATLQPTGRAEPSAPAGQVTGQVFPEVARLVSRGDGTQRITLKLSPEALGDVRVVLTVKDGAVHVRLTGSEQAQQALRAGAPELQRLLDLAGAATSQVVVGDRSGSADAAPGGAATDRHAGQQPQDHRTAGTRNGDRSARDGSTGGSQPRHSTDLTATRGGVTRALAGVDVTI